MALLRQADGVAAQVLENLNINLKDIRKEVLKELETFNLQLPPMGTSSPGTRQLVPPLNPRIRGLAGEKMPALKAYGHDLTELCREGKLDPVIGRKEEVERLILILCRRRKNNPVLIGEAGVGKTAIVEGSGPRDCQRGCSRSFGQKTADLFGFDIDDCRHQIPGAIRREDQGCHGRDQKEWQCPSFHRRAPYDCRSWGCRGGH